MNTIKHWLIAVSLTGLLAACDTEFGHDHDQYEEEFPDVTYSPADSTEAIPVAPSGETYTQVDAARRQIHVDAGHGYNPIITGSIPELFEKPTMQDVQDFIIHKDEMVVIEPAPGEFIHVMEGKRHGFDKLTVALTNTHKGSGAPLHTHTGEEAHLLLKGKMMYHLNGEEVIVEAPYIINIPSMVPHAFMNVDDDPAELIGIFPDDKWEYDVLDGAVFATANTENGTQRIELSVEDIEQLRSWHNAESAQKRINAYEQNKAHMHVHSAEGHSHSH